MAALPPDAAQLSVSELHLPLKSEDIGRRFEVSGEELNAIHRRAGWNGMVVGVGLSFTLVMAVILHDARRR